MSYSIKAKEWVIYWKCRFGSCWYKDFLNYCAQWDSSERAYEIWQKITKMEMYKTTFLWSMKQFRQWNRDIESRK